MLIRSETPADQRAIFDVTQAAFRGHPHSEQTEAYIVQALRAAGALTLSLVAELDARVVGHAAFSPVQISDGSPSWFGLGPVSVDPAHQGRGIGTALIEHGLARLQARGAAGCVLVGEPAYYGRFGFRPEPGLLVLPDMPPTHFLALTFGAPARGTVTYHPGFAARDA